MPAREVARQLDAPLGFVRVLSEVWATLGYGSAGTTLRWKTITRLSEPHPRGHKYPSGANSDAVHFLVRTRRVTGQCDKRVVAPLLVLS
jgi:hypothetical protein